MILTATGASLPNDRILDGRDPTPTLTGASPSPHDALHWVWDQGRNEQWRGMRQGQYKIVRKSDQEPWQLYDLDQDVGETTDLATARPELLQSLTARFEGWQKQIDSDSTRSTSLRP